MNYNKKNSSFNNSEASPLRNKTNSKAMSKSALHEFNDNVNYIKSEHNSSFGINNIHALENEVIRHSPVKYLHTENRNVDQNSMTLNNLHDE